jgi:hypothetical protein
MLGTKSAGSATGPAVVLSRSSNMQTDSPLAALGIPVTRPSTTDGKRSNRKSEDCHGSCCWNWGFL